MRTVHRYVAAFVVLFALYIGFSGVFIQLIDLKALLGDAPAIDPTIQAIRVGQSGPPNFQVIGEPDYSADALPADFDFDRALATVVQSGRVAIGNAPVAFLELRMIDGKPVGQVASDGRLFRFDAATGAMAGAPSKASIPPLSLPSLRNTVKDVHRMRVFSQWALIVDVIAGVALCVMIVTGVLLYFQLLRRVKHSNPFWFAGGWWRTLHRAIGVVAAFFLLAIALSGIVLASSSVGVAINSAMHQGKRPGLTADVSSPLSDAELPAMLHTTLAAYGAAAGRDAAVKVLRLRYFAGMPQGVIVTGGEETRQLAFNARTGRVASFSEPGYPDAGMPFGWDVPQIAKRIHRGDVIGLTGRWISLFAGLSLLYLSISGAVIYFDLWNRRRHRGFPGLFWSSRDEGPVRIKSEPLLTVRVARKTIEAEAIAGFELVAAKSGALPAFEAGAHLNVHVPGGMVRQYSLSNPPGETHRYRIGVLRDPSGRGGSAAMHDRVSEGSLLQISAPMNHFPLHEEASHSLLFAGGIGITPIVAMAERLASLGAAFELHYATRSLARTAYAERLRSSAFADRVHFHFDDGAPDQKLDLVRQMQAPHAGVHLYVCGPKGFMDAVLATARDAGWSEANLHFEYFAGREVHSSHDRHFDVVINSSGRVIRIEAAQAVTQALAGHGIRIPTSCEQGVCGTCLTGVLEGEIDHRDLYLNDDEKAMNDQFLPCCSRAKSERLVLDL